MIYEIVGRREQGKTTLALYLTRHARARVLFDPRGLMPTAPNQVRITKTPQLRAAFDELWEETGEHHVSRDLVCTPDDDVQFFFQSLSVQIKKWVREPGARRLDVVLDEVRFVDTQIPAFDWILRMATRDQVVIVMTAHRPKDITTDVRAITDVWLFFRMTQRHDLDVVDTIAGPGIAEQVSRLRDRQFIAWDDTKGTAKVFTDPSAWFVRLNPSAQLPAISRDLTLPEGAIDPVDTEPRLLRQLPRA